MKLILKLLPPGQNAKTNTIEFDFDHITATNSQNHEIVVYKNQRTILGKITVNENNRRNKWLFKFINNHDKEQIMEVHKWDVRIKSTLFSPIDDDDNC